MTGQFLKEAQLWFSVFSCEVLPGSGSVRIVAKLDTQVDMVDKDLDKAVVTTNQLLGYFAAKKLVTSSSENCQMKLYT